MKRSILLSSTLLLLGTGLLRAEEMPASSPDGKEVYRFNCGADGYDLTDTQHGNTFWLKDELFTENKRWGFTGGTQDDAEDRGVVIVAENATISTDVYRTNRFGDTGMMFQVELPNGSYEVTLHFAEVYWTEVGKRIFDVALQGNTVLNDLDLVRVTGGIGRPYQRVYSATVSSETLTVTFPEIKQDNALISGIEVKVASVSNDAFLNFLQRKHFRYFWEEAGPGTGLVSDKSSSWFDQDFTTASIATTGMGLSVLTVAVERGWLTPAAAKTRILETLAFFQAMQNDPARSYHGFWYHFVDWKTGTRNYGSEVSTVDSALFILGALQAGEYFRDRLGDNSIALKADALYQKMEWNWFTFRGYPDIPFVSMGWKPEAFPGDSEFVRFNAPDGGAFLPNAYWNMYAESVFVDLLALASTNYPITKQAWTDMRRHGSSYPTGGIYEYMHVPPLFTHQYQNLYYDLRNKHDGLADYWDAAVKATQRDIQQCAADARYKTNIWGLTACEAQNKGYMVYGTQPDGYRDGTAAPTGPLASLHMTPVESLASGRAMYFQYKHAIWGRHGFTDSFNTSLNERADNALGLDNAPIVLAIENQRSNLVRSSFMKSAVAINGLSRAGFVATGAAPRYYSSSEKDGHHAQYAFDKNTATRWESVWADGEWLAVDFGKNTTVSHVRLLWEDAYADTYAVQKSADGVSWSDVQTVAGSDGGQDDVFFAPVAARFFRLFAIRRHVTPYGVWGSSLWEASFEHRAPAAPTEMTSVRQTGTSLHWAWKDNADNEEGYRLYGASSAAGPFVLVAQLPANTTSHVEFSLAPGSTYFRKVVAHNRAGETPSNVATAATMPLFAVFGPPTADGVIRAAMDDAGKVHVTHFDPALQGIRYAVWGGSSWTLDEMIDPQASGYPADDGSGFFLAANDLAVDAAGRPHVVYYSLNGTLNYAVKNAGVWTTQTIAPVAHSVSPTLAVDPAGGVHVAYSDPGTLYYARRGTATWTVEPVAGGVTANTNHIALDATGRPYIAYGTNEEPHSLQITRREAAVWAVPETADLADPTETWRYRVNPTLLFDGNGLPRVVDCLNNRGGRVRYSVRSTETWSAEYAHYDEPDWYHTGTPDPGFLLDGAGTPHTLYDMHFNYDPHYTRVTLARRTPLGWQETTLAEDARWGPGSALVMDALGRAHIVTQSTEGRLRLIRWDTGAPAPLGGGRNSRVQAPTGFAVTLTTTGLRCVWQDRASNETGYRVYGATRPEGPFSIVGNAAANATSLTVPIPASVAYYAYASARNAGGEALSNLAALNVSSAAPVAATNLTGTSSSTSVLTWRWSDSPNEAYYQVRTSTDGLLHAGNLPANTTIFLQKNLLPNSGHRVKVLAFNANGIYSATPASTETYTRANAPTGTAVSLSNLSATLVWQRNSNPTYTQYVAFSSLNGITYTSFKVTTGTSAVKTGLVPGKKYWFKVGAKNAYAGYPFTRYFTFGSTVSVTVPLIGTQASSDPSQRLPALDFQFAEAIAEESYIILEDSPEETLPPPAAPWRAKSNPVRVETYPEDPALLTVKAEGLDLSGSFSAARWSEDSQTWMVLPPGTASPPGDFILLYQPMATLDAARIFPNPFRPAQGGPAYVTFGNLPAGTSVRLYSLAGELVRELFADGGSVQWDGKNQDGRAVASGIYIGVVESDGNTKKFRLAVEQ